ncbi:alpha/beta hydrolase fold domain-containing protein [Sphingomonas bacterium]|uniref:alpha/beta hydrolase fold domain-containing protein n=1 Tax=Sphingomonas bacterium TaxID=1895847 RepID=UPI0015777A8C|nr:alpha/beta hydrolase [Sphingomonas bacterium]
MRVPAISLSLLLALALAGSAATGTEPSLRFQVPSTVSPEAAKALSAIYAVAAKQPPEVKPASVEDWDRLREALDKRMIPASNAVVAKLGATVQDDQIGGVPVVRIRPANYTPSGRTLIYFHGGGYTRFSAHSRLGPPALVAAATGDEVISVDYTVAPRGNWKIVTDQVISVWKALLAKGIAPSSTGLFGDSAGGGIAAGSVFKMRDLGLPLPGALYLMSPSCDVTQQGDSYQTLSSVDPVLDRESSAWGAAAYADPQDQKNPYVSAVYGDYTKAYPPTLIQGGTREMLLSNYVREYQAIRGGGHEAVLDIYEGVPHVFQGSIPNTPEARTAIARAAAFFKLHLTAR